MKSTEKFWDEKKRVIASLCEDKNCRLFYDVLQEMYYIVKKFSDGSVYHTRDTQLFQNRNINKISEFISLYKN